MSGQFVITTSDEMEIDPTDWIVTDASRYERVSSEMILTDADKREIVTIPPSRTYQLNYVPVAVPGGGGDPVPEDVLPLTEFTYFNLNYDVLNSDPSYTGVISANIPAEFIGGFREGASGPTSTAASWSTYWAGSGAWLRDIHTESWFTAGRELYINSGIQAAVAGTYSASWEANVKWKCYGLMSQFPNAAYPGIRFWTGFNEPDQYDSASSWPLLVQDYTDKESGAAIASGKERLVRSYRLMREQLKATAQGAGMTAPAHVGLICGPTVANSNRASGLPINPQMWNLNDFWTYNAGEPFDYIDVADSHHHYFHGSTRWGSFASDNGNEAGAPTLNSGSAYHHWLALNAGNAARVSAGKSAKLLPMLLSEVGRGYDIANGTWTSYRHTLRAYALASTYAYMYRFGISMWIFYALAGSGAAGQNLLDASSSYSPFTDYPADPTKSTIAMLKEIVDYRKYDINLFSSSLPAKTFLDYWKPWTWTVVPDTQAGNAPTTTPPSNPPWTEWANVTFEGPQADAPNGRVSTLGGKRLILARPVMLRRLGEHTITVDVRLKTSGSVKLRAWGFNKLNGLQELSPVPVTSSTGWTTLTGRFTPTQHNVVGLPNPCSFCFAVDYNGTGTGFQMRNPTITQPPLT